MKLENKWMNVEQDGLQSNQKQEHFTFSVQYHMHYVIFQNFLSTGTGKNRNISQITVNVLTKIENLTA